MYVPKQILVFTAAFAGALAGMGVSDRVPTDTTPTDYAGLTSVAGAFAQSFDTTWGVTAPTQLDIETIEAVCEAVWEGRAPQPSTQTLNPTNYTGLCEALLAIVQEGSAYFTSQGIVPPPIPGAGGAGTQYSYLLQPGGVAGANVYIDFPTLYAAKSLIAGPAIIEVDSSLGAANIPAGGPYDLNEVTFVAAKPAQSVLSIDPGATIAPGTLHIGDGLMVQNNSLAAVMTAVAGGAFVFLDVYNGAVLSCPAAGAGPFLSCPAAATSIVMIRDGGTLGEGTNIVVLGAVGAHCFVQVTGRSAFANNSVGGTGLMLHQARVGYDDTTQTPIGALSGIVDEGQLSQAALMLFAENPAPLFPNAPFNPQDAINYMAQVLNNRPSESCAAAGPFAASPAASPIGLVSGFIPSPNGAGKVRVHIDCNFHNADAGNPHTAYLGVAIVAHGAPAPAAADYGNGPTTMATGAVGVGTSLTADYGAGNFSLPALALPGPAGGYDIYAMGSGDDAINTITANGAVQIAVQELFGQS